MSTNLALKGVLGIYAMSRISNALGLADDVAYYMVQTASPNSSFERSYFQFTLGKSERLLTTMGIHSVHTFRRTFFFRPAVQLVCSTSPGCGGRKTAGLRDSCGVIRLPDCVWCASLDLLNVVCRVLITCLQLLTLDWRTTARTLVKPKHVRIVLASCSWHTELTGMPL